ncbi:Uncharacterised protein [uncultured archaeon]|nr:Uncharacterised protein [uncultured archaeon]
MNSTRLAYLLIAINMLAFFYGMYYYGDQLAETAPALWLLVVDCPLQALLFAAVIFLAASGKGSDLLTAFTAAGSLKYGLWTMFVILFHGDYFLVGSLALGYSLIFLAHVGQFLEGLFLSGIKEMSAGTAIAILLLYLFNDYSDYIWGTHPLIPDRALGTVAAVTIGLSFLSVAFVYLAGRMGLDAFGWIKELKGVREMIRK